MISEQSIHLSTTLAMREKYRDWYWRKRDPIYQDRLLWRAQSFRHIVHLLPNETILELGAGQGLFSEQLFQVSRGENPITSVTFNTDQPRPDNLPHLLEFLNTVTLPGVLLGRRFNYIVAMDLLDKRNCSQVLQIAFELLKTGGQVIFYESNPWNLILGLRQSISKYFGAKDPRRLLNRHELYELISEIGFIRIFAVYNDFVYAPLTRSLVWLLRNLSILLENTPIIKTLAGSILIHAQKPPRIVHRPKISLCSHEQFREAVSVVIPCYNEEMNIGPLISALIDFFGEYIIEIIPVEDNSQDNTADVLRRLAAANSIIKPIFRSPPNGVGRAIADGLRKATGRYVLSMDCDFKLLLPEIRDLFDAAAEGYDVVVGSRFSRHSVLLNYPFQKIIANRAFHLLARIMLFRHFRDLTNNLKLMRREVVETLQLTQPGFAVNAETGFQPLLMGCSVKEVPISWINRTPDMGVSSFNLIKVGGGYWHVLFQLWRKTLFGFKQLPQKKNSNPCQEAKLEENVTETKSEIHEHRDKRAQIVKEELYIKKPASRDTETRLDALSRRCAGAFVWSVWFVMMFVALACFAKFGRNIPLTEDWLFVPTLTGNETDLVNWLWSQNNEHRIPLPRLIMLILLKITQGDFRVGMLFNIVSLGIIAIFMIQTVKQLRGGRTRYTDAFFPIILLHLGNWENLFWSWQLSFVLPTVLICLLISVLVRYRVLATRSASVIAGTCLVLLPLCGANGLLLAPFLTLWFGYNGMLHWHAMKNKDGQRWFGKFLLGSAVVALCLSSLYFVGYDRPSWTPPFQGISESLKSAIQFLALGFGPVARSLQKLLMIAAIGLLLSGVFYTVLGIIRHKDQENSRAIGVLVLFVTFAGFSIAMGWGRAGVVSSIGYWPIRYVLLAMPIFCTAYFAWELYSPKKIRTVLQSGLFWAICLLIPFNTIHGLWWRDWYLNGADAVKKDLMAGTPRSILAQRHRNFLFHSIEQSKLEELIQMLHDEGIGPFAQMKENPVETAGSIPNPASTTNARLFVIKEFRYHMPDAGEVFLVWGIDGWQALPEEIRPVGTKMKNQVMHTPMVRDGETFVIKVKIPQNTTIEYGFLITKDRSGANIIKSIWDGDKNYQTIVSEKGVVEVKSPLKLDHGHVSIRVVHDDSLAIQEIRYRMPDAGKVFFVWGIDGWHALPPDKRPPGTRIKNKVMHTPMVRGADTFVAKFGVPINTTLNYGFLITGRRGIFDFTMPFWDQKKEYQKFVIKSGIVDVRSRLSLPDEISDIIDNGLYFIAAITILFVSWFLLFNLLRFLAHKY